MTAVLESVQRYASEPESGRVRSTVTATGTVGQPSRLSGGKCNWEIDLPQTPQFGVRIDDVRAVAQCGSDFEGLLGVEGNRPNRTVLALEITIDSPDGQDKIDRVTRAWLLPCPIYLALPDPHDVTVSFISADAAGAEK